jgi:hypothetical protein
MSIKHEIRYLLQKSLALEPTIFTYSLICYDIKTKNILIFIDKHRDIVTRLKLPGLTVAEHLTAAQTVELVTTHLK